MGTTRVIVEQSVNEKLEVHVNSKAGATFSGLYVDLTVGNVSFLVRDPGTLDEIALGAMAGGLTLREEINRVATLPRADDDDDDRSDW